MGQAILSPPSSMVAYMDELCATIENLHGRFKNCVLWIGGDLNLPDINWKTLSVNGNRNALDINQQFIGMVMNVGVQQMVHFPTRGSNTLDLFLSNRPSLINHCTALPGIGDHDIVFIDSGITPFESQTTEKKGLLVE